MKPSIPQTHSLVRRLWTAIFYLSGAVFLGCLVTIVTLPYLLGSAMWVYLLAVGTAIVFAVAAVQRERLTLDRFHAADDASWLARMFRTTSKDSADSLDTGDD